MNKADNLPMSAKEYFKVKYPKFYIGKQDILDTEDYANYLLSHHINVLAERIVEKAKVHQHSRDYKVGTIAPIVRQKIMISEVHKDTIREIAKDYINELNLQSSK